ncbi:CU044_5270 family protein [Kribbella sp. NPDC051620]|uniref:CU044_5270 family protein n=1 Tax=Kribbella sp. NPDC051620 TaxID=3364120 RepID=UPI0037B0A1CE
MTEIDLLKRLRDDVPAPDPLALARARQRLFTPPPPHRRVTRARLLVAGGLALTLAGGFLAADVVGNQSSPLPGTVADASTVLADAAALSATNPDAPIPAGQYREVTTLADYLYEFGPGHKYRATTRVKYVDWTTADPTRRYVSTFYPLVSVKFATPEARAAAPRYAPYLLTHPRPTTYRVNCNGVGLVGDTSGQVFKATCKPGWAYPTAAFLARQPRDPDALLAVLRNVPLFDHTPRNQLERAREKLTSKDQLAFGRIATVLNSGLAPADLRAALYQATRKIPGIQLLGDVTTLDGRPGRAIGYTGVGQRQDIIISPTTGQSIGSRLVTNEEGAALAKANQTGRNQPGDIEQQTAVTTRLTRTAPHPN